MLLTALNSPPPGSPHQTAPLYGMVEGAAERSYWNAMHAAVRELKVNTRVHVQNVTDTVSQVHEYFDDYIAGNTLSQEFFT